jgi:hypothetical protein
MPPRPEAAAPDVEQRVLGLQAMRDHEVELAPPVLGPITADETQVLALGDLVGGEDASRVVLLIAVRFDAVLDDSHGNPSSSLWLYCAITIINSACRAR